MTGLVPSGEKPTPGCIPLVRLPGAPRLPDFFEPPMKRLAAAVHQAPVVIAAPSLEAVAFHLSPDQITGVILVPEATAQALGPCSWCLPMPANGDLTEALRLATVLGQLRHAQHLGRQQALESGRLQRQLRILDANVQQLTAARTALRLAHDQLVAQEAELRATRDQALAGDRAKTTFLATMSHELRTPLNGIIGMTEILQVHPLTPEQDEAVDIIRACGGQLLELVNDLLLLSSADAGLMRVQPSVMDPLAPLEELAAVVAAQAEAKGLVIAIEPGPNLPASVVGDPVRIRQTLAPLVSNALKFTQSGAIWLGAAVDPEGGIIYSVRDTGPGIDPVVAAQLFHPFVQGEEYLSRRHGGSGLGLAIAQRLSHLLGGELRIEPRPERGACFFLTLPIACLTDQKPDFTASGGVQTAIRDPDVARIVLAILAHVGITPTPAGRPWLITDDPQFPTDQRQVILICGPRAGSAARLFLGDRLRAAGFPTPALIRQALVGSEQTVSG